MADSGYEVRERPARRRERPPKPKVEETPPPPPIVDSDRVAVYRVPSGTEEGTPGKMLHAHVDERFFGNTTGAWYFKVLFPPPSKPSSVVLKWNPEIERATVQNFWGFDYWFGLKQKRQR